MYAHIRSIHQKPETIERFVMFPTYNVEKVNKPKDIYINVQLNIIDYISLSNMNVIDTKQISKLSNR